MIVQNKHKISGVTTDVITTHTRPAEKLKVQHHVAVGSWEFWRPATEASWRRRGCRDWLVGTNGECWNVSAEGEMRPRLWRTRLSGPAEASLMKGSVLMESPLWPCASRSYGLVAVTRSLRRQVGVCAMWLAVKGDSHPPREMPPHTDCVRKATDEPLLKRGDACQWAVSIGSSQPNRNRRRQMTLGEVSNRKKLKQNF